MAKKSLKKRIDDLVDALGRAKKPTVADIRSELVVLGTLAEALENEQALAEKDARITDLEAQFGSVQVALKTANAEIQAFRAERKKQQEEKREIPPIQFEILTELPSHHSGSSRTIDEIRRAVGGIQADEAGIHLDRLEKAKLIERAYDELNRAIWHRTIAGDELVVAKRLAGEEESAKQKARERPDELPKMESLVLPTVAKHEGMTAPEIVEQINKSIPTIGKPMTSLPVVAMAPD